MKRPWLAAAMVLAAVSSSVVIPTGVANADVCAGVGRRVSVSGCRNLAAPPPPSDYAPLPQDFPPPPPPPPNVNVCVGVGRRIHISGCT